MRGSSLGRNSTQEFEAVNYKHSKKNLRAAFDSVAGGGGIFCLSKPIVGRVATKVKR